MICCALESITIHTQEVSAFTTQWMWMSHIILNQTKFLFLLHRLTASCDSFSKPPTHLPTHSHKTSQRTGRERLVCYPHQGSSVPFCSGLEGSKVTWVCVAMVIALGVHWETARAVKSFQERCYFITPRNGNRISSQIFWLSLPGTDHCFRVTQYGCMSQSKTRKQDHSSVTQKKKVTLEIGSFDIEKAEKLRWWQETVTHKAGGGCRSSGCDAEVMIRYLFMAEVGTGKDYMLGPGKRLQMACSASLFLRSGAVEIAQSINCSLWK